MKIALISDVHSNLPALKAVLSDVDKSDVDEIWCLGDIVGYNAHPVECIDLIAEKCSLILAGNHDGVIAKTATDTMFSGDIKESVDYTRSKLDNSTLNWLSKLKPKTVRHGVHAFHASYYDPWNEFISAEIEAKQQLHKINGIGVFGHTHVPAMWCMRPIPKHVQGDLEAIKSWRVINRYGMGTHSFVGYHTLINPGAVGRGKYGARWSILDLEKQTNSFHISRYDVRETNAGIIAAGLPESFLLEDSPLNVCDFKP